MIRQQHTITINLGDRSYPVIVGCKNLAKLGTTIKELNLGTGVFLITDNTVGALYKNEVVQHLKQAGVQQVQVGEIPSGEQSKTIANWEKMLSEIADFDNGLNKQLVVVNLGGGVMGDLGGFVAASYRRGINYVQAPTTLLANVDSAVGGKVAVNFKNGKNLIGAFYQPNLVYVDLNLLRSLPLAELKTGLAEVIKYGVIADKDLFHFLEENYQQILNCHLKEPDYNWNALEHIVIRSYEIKARIVELDERDTKGIRAKLNFGHTFAHAIEGATNYSRYRHGDAVAIGMICACELGNLLGMFSKEETNALEDLIKKIGLPTHIKGCTLPDILKYLSHDKKFVNKKNRLVLPRKLGEVVIEEGVDETLLEQVIAQRILKSA
jgi:3-dehydroquinate synthase